MTDYGNGLSVDWTEFEYNKIQEIQRRLPQKRSTTIRKRAGRLLLNSGMDRGEIAKQFGISRKLVQQDLHVELQKSPKFIQKGKTFVAHNYFSMNDRVLNKIFKKITMKRVKTIRGALIDMNYRMSG